ncbi:fatty acid synthase [Rhizoclosmatium globosum]|uniref:Fatty acid synthase n=1 Tax=Rhizoclosmatium globosum TaxID=329046 RepID=A0A1Y2C246_9FUNG|nr:fatty acid synthase [Rhizoclosmatium globosum]|eukprot:ORY41089.1 fatty acid synthase [Rhizoclosmatium globosum]
MTSTAATAHAVQDVAAAAATTASAAAPGNSRGLVIRRNGTEVTIPIPLALWPVAEVVREKLTASDDDDAAVVLHARVLAGALAESLPLAAVVFERFHSSFAATNDIHAVVRTLTAPQRRFVLKTFYAAVAALKALGAPTLSASHSSALLEAAEQGKARLSVIFGGQGNVEEYFAELEDLFDVYEAFATPFLKEAAVTLLQHSTSEKARKLYADRIDVMEWLQKPETKPNTQSLLATDLSLPLIGLTQLLAYWVTLKIANKTPGELRSLIQGTTGHSQGIVSSIVIASSETEKEFLENTQKALGLLFWIGLRSQNAWPSTTLDPKILQDSLDSGEGVPTPMLLVSGLRRGEIAEHIEQTNQHLPTEKRIQLSLINGPRACICTGPPQSLYGLNVALRKIKAAPGENQNRIPFSQRKVRFTSRFLPVTVPFHSENLKDVPAILEQDIKEHSLSFVAEKVKIPVFHTKTGEDLAAAGDNLTLSLVEQICTLPVLWEVATKQNVTHILDFGPGGSSGIGGLTHRNKEGTGVQVILAASLEMTSSELFDKSYFFDHDTASIRFAPNWAEQFRPKLVKIASTNEIQLDTSFSRLLSKPPLMVAGMTPCTMDAQFVSAIINAGYHVELAGGGQHTEGHLRARVNQILGMVGAGAGITLNILFLNPRLWGFQYPATMAMRKEGIPMEGICIAAGVPSLDVADEVVGNLKKAGIRHVAFKPGSVEDIRRVISIAKNAPDMPVILQWTGGRGGGHHSFEDFHQPMLETYAAIRRVPNITIVVGSGFGDAEGTVPYLTGEWSTQFDYAPMPFDGILVGSRVMVAKEATTSRSVKELICAAPGIAMSDESSWEKTYKGPTGGIVTVKSELGEPIHKIANRGVMFWKEMDETILSLPREKRVAALNAKKDYIISKLNSDFQKPWFGKKADGRPCDLHEMTYKEVADRMVELLFIKKQGRWIDVTLRDTTTDFMRRVEERFNKKETVSLIQSDDALQVDPHSFVEALFEAYPEAVEQTLTQEDVFHFLSIATIPWRKPPPFIPVFDEKFEFWLKKDSLWQSEDVDAVIDADAGRVAILQGPVAVHHSKTVDEPVADILGNMYKGQIAAIKEKYYNNSDANIPVVEYLGVQPSVRALEEKAAKVTTTVLRDADGTTMMYEVPRSAKELPDLNDWVQTLAGTEVTWLRALLTTEAVVRGKLLTPNPIINLVRPRAKQTVFVKLDAANKPQVLSVYSSRLTGSVPSRHAALVISIEGDRITVTISEKRGADYVPLQFFFTYKPAQGHAPIHEDMEGRNQRIKEFYGALWNVKKDEFGMKPTDTFTSSFQVEAQQLQDFIHIVDNRAELYHQQTESVAPMDFGIVAGWKSIVTAILPKEIDGDLLKLVHLGNEFRVLSDVMIVAGDKIDTKAVINSITMNDSGKTVEVKATLSKGGEPVLEIISRFLYRGKFNDYENAFRRTVETPIQVKLQSVKDVAVLKAKTWVKWNADAPEITPGTTLIFRLDTFARNKSAAVYSEIKTTGSVQIRTTRETFEIGRVEYSAENCYGNVVMDYLQRVGTTIEQDVFFSNGGYSILPDPKVFPATVVVPTSNEAYAQASLDLNPIHVNPFFADLANLPGTITHGMWTSASTRKFVEIFAANNEPKRVKEYSVTFMGMVLPGDQLETKLHHKLIKITTGSAKVEQPTTAFVFTGQGSQEVGMGMDLYAKSAVAKDVWDRADSHMLGRYGVSILEIVRSNPISKTIHFGGIKGAAIRDHYRQLIYQTVVDGQVQSLPLFPDIHEDTPSYTFSHPAGLLSATQFTQPALTLMEFASFHDMKTNGVVPQDSVFAGHSLGEYAGLTAVGETLSIESLVDVVFYRGMTMQVAVPRDAQGRSDYGMCAVNPVRVSHTFGDKALVFVVQSISRRSKDLLEIVNYNVENFQYVMAGSLTNLDVLRRTLNKVKGLNLNFIELVRTKTIAEIEAVLDEICDEAIAGARAKKAADGVLVPERGVATIPLPGIDVPFHSSFLLNGVAPFREILIKSFDPARLNVNLLKGKYIPNLTAVPFALSKEYFEMTYQQTKSEPLKKVLDNWDEAKNSTPQGQQILGHCLLVELLAYQFASPVRWIETQDLIFKKFEVERLIEVGPNPVLSGMAIRTLKMKYEAYDDAVTRRRVQLCTSKDRKDIYYEFEDVAVEESAPAPAAASAAPVAAAPVAVAAPVAAAPAASSGAVSDAPITAGEILYAVIAHKLKKPLAEIAPTKSIKDLVGGKSTLQNEILGDLGAEFGNVLAEKAEELPLKEVATALQNAHSGNLGKTSTTLVTKLVSAKMPAGFGMNAVKAHLKNAFGLGPKRAEGVLVHGLTIEPAGRLGSEAEAKAWLESAAQGYSAKVGVALGSSVSLGGGASSGGAAVMGGAVMNSEEFNLQKLKTDLLIRSQMEQFAKYLDIDLLGHADALAAGKEERETLQKQLDLWSAEHGDFYENGIKPAFTKLKVRTFDSSWNWARQDALQLYYDIIFGRITSVDRELMNQCVHLMNRAEDYESLISFMEYYINNCPVEKGENYARVQELGKVLLDNCKAALNSDPVYKNIAYRPTKPTTTVSESGNLVYKEERRTATNMKEYVKDMKTGSDLTKIAKATPAENLPFLYLKRRNPAEPSHWEADGALTKSYFDVLASIAADGVSFKNKTVLITGCGKDSIGVEILKALLSGGACVLVTTSSFSRSATEYYRSIYERHGSKGSRLIVVPFNGGSLQDTKALVEYIYDTDPKNGLGWDLDFVIPFAAISVQGREIDGIDSRSELAHRIMLTNLVRLMGEIKIQKQKLGYITRPAAVMLPLSPNHGTFGGDGLYGESKIGLETLLNRFHAEGWKNYLTIIGAVIGWTRGTGLMSSNDVVAEGIESLGARTFSNHEMAFNLIGLLHPSIVKLSYTEPIWADLNGGLSNVKDLDKFSFSLRKELMETSEIRRAIAHERSLDEKVIKGPVKQVSARVTPRANMKFAFPELPKTQNLTHLRGVIDLEKTVVVTGFGEVGPWGSSRTRWEMESTGEFSLEGCIEMAWMMGFIKFHNGPLKKLPSYSGWIDVETQEPVKDIEVKKKYEKKILEHTGIRLIEPELFNGYNPNKKVLLQEVIVTTEMAPIEASKEEADAFKLAHGANAIVEEVDGAYYVRLKKGANIYLPKALRFDRLVAGQIPTGWDAKRYGIPDDIVSQVDPVTLYTLVATVEALITSGVTDPYEFYQYVHVSEVGNTSGGGMGGMRAMQKIFKERFIDRPVQQDILQESFINTMAAWVNMLLLSSSGPIKTPVGACATAAESVDIAYDTIMSGKARIVLCGGFDDFQEEGSQEFANMKATSNSIDEFAMGREPRDMCRPATDTRGGFMEAQGAGIHVIMTADLAIKMGVPIRGIIAAVNTATDKNGRSVPAPGQGILTSAREHHGKFKSPLLSFEYRSKQLKREREHIKTWVAKEYEALADEVEEMKKNGEADLDEFVKHRTDFIEREGVRKEKAALSTWSHDWWKKDNSISPLKGALATFGMTVDDIGVASFHGTGTKANDYNESSALNQQMEHLGRSKGNVLPSIFQKYLTGHPKGAAAAWMLNGVLQVLETGIIPGNRNLDNTEDRLAKFRHIIYTSRTIQTDGVKAGILKSFGFGQAGGEVLVLHPDYLYAALESNEYASYRVHREARQINSYRYYHEALTGVAPFVRVKNAAPYTDAQQSSVYLNPMARASKDNTGSWSFNEKGIKNSTLRSTPAETEVSQALIAAAAEVAPSAGQGVGVDVQLISEVNVENSVFVERNFTAAEIAYCSKSSSPQSSFAGRWAAKEAVVKAVSSLASGAPVWTKGSAAPLAEIEVLREEGKAPVVVFHGDAKAAVEKAGVKNVKITISHSGSYAVAMAIAE